MCLIPLSNLYIQHYTSNQMYFSRKYTEVRGDLTKQYLNEQKVHIKIRLVCCVSRVDNDSNLSVNPLIAFSNLSKLSSFSDFLTLPGISPYAKLEFPLFNSWFRPYCYHFSLYRFKMFRNLCNHTLITLYIRLK